MELDNFNRLFLFYQGSYDDLDRNLGNIWSSFCIMLLFLDHITFNYETSKCNENERYLAVQPNHEGPGGSDPSNNNKKIFLSNIKHNIFHKHNVYSDQCFLWFNCWLGPFIFSIVNIKKRPTIPTVTRTPNSELCGWNLKEV